MNKKERDMLEALRNVVFEKYAENMQLDWEKNKWRNLEDNRRTKNIDRYSNKEKNMVDDKTHFVAWGWMPLHSLIIKGMIEGIRSRGRPRTKYASQIMQDAGVTTYI